MSQCQILFSCVFQRMLYSSCAISSPRLPKTSPEEPSREDIDSCSRRILTPEGITIRSKRRTLRELRAPTQPSNLTIKSMEVQELRSSLRTSSLMRSQRTSKVRRRTWKCTWISSTRESTPSWRLWRRLISRWPRWETRRLSLSRSTIRRISRIREGHQDLRRSCPLLRCSRAKSIQRKIRIEDS